MQASTINTFKPTKQSSRINGLSYHIVLVVLSIPTHIPPPATGANISNLKLYARANVESKRASPVLYVFEPSNIGLHLFWYRIKIQNKFIRKYSLINVASFHNIAWFIFIRRKPSVLNMSHTSEPTLRGLSYHFLSTECRYPGRTGVSRGGVKYHPQKPCSNQRMPENPKLVEKSLC